MSLGLTADQRAARVQWVRDLVSGDYEQGNGSLVRRRDDDTKRYCCLGVAGVQIGDEALYSGLQPLSYLSDEHARVFGLSQGDQGSAASWNDDNGFGFDRIADFVAYATDLGLDFEDVDEDLVSDGFATEWLTRQDS